MPKRVLAVLVTAGLPFVATGCHGGGMGDCAGCMELAVVTAPVWVPIVLIDNAVKERKAREAADVGAATRDAAEKGDAEAQFKLGAMYFVLSDDREAAKWYQKSADQGFGHAQFRLGTMYEAGFGVAKDYVQADMWYTIAASAEKSTAPEKENAIRWRDSIEKRMTPDQIAEAKKRAQEWNPISDLRSERAAATTSNNLSHLTWP